MFLKRKSTVIFRDYGLFGYITDNRNFGYRLKGQRVIGDKILSESGTVFFSALADKPQPLELIAEKIKAHYKDCNISTIINDAQKFYSILERDGFLITGKSPQECEENDNRFSYKMSSLNTQRVNSFATREPSNDTQDFFEKHFRGRPQLTSLHIEITSKCNERCKHCYIPHENKNSEIDPNLFYNILDQSTKMKLLHLTLSGGEPMLHKCFCDFLKRCREHNFSVNVLSNLTLLTDKIVKELKANALLGVQTSLYSMDPTIHDAITQCPGSFEKTKSSILKLIGNDIPLQISCPIIKQNKDCYSDVIEWAQRHKLNAGDDYVIIGRYNHSTQNLSCRLTIDEVKNVMQSKVATNVNYIKKLQDEANAKKNNGLDDSICSVCNSSLCISDNGDVYPCAGWQSYIVGNARDQKIKTIWLNSKKIQYLRMLRRRDFPKCINCAEKDFCTMCMVRNANESRTGDPLEINEYFCRVARLTKEIVLSNKI